MTSPEEIEEIIKPLLLTHIDFLLENKKIKSGKFILFSVRDFFCVFTFHDIQKNKNIIYEIPYPFNVYKTKDGVVFDYTVDTFCEKNLDINSHVTKIVDKKTSKLFNKKLFVISQ
jgi:hypothetical protein